MTPVENIHIDYMEQQVEKISEKGLRSIKQIQRVFHRSTIVHDLDLFIDGKKFRFRVYWLRCVKIFLFKIYFNNEGPSPGEKRLFRPKRKTNKSPSNIIRKKLTAEKSNQNLKVYKYKDLGSREDSEHSVKDKKEELHLTQSFKRKSNRNNTPNRPNKNIECIHFQNLRISMAELMHESFGETDIKKKKT